MSLYSHFVDIDECMENIHMCDGNAQCRDTFGSYDCLCNAGYHGNGFHCCEYARAVLVLIDM